jgi:MYXO-CTERM domain-containing protein
MGAPRLVEYWEQDPCMRWEETEEESGGTGTAMALDEGKMGKKDSDGVTVEAQFAVGEYQIVILSATDSTGLERWLINEKYKIPAGAEPLLRPYVEGGSKFFVAKVDPAKVKFEDGQAALSPLRFHYDQDELTLPIRLGLANSSGKQDLIVTVLSPEGRYEVSNYGNVTIPTNLDVRDEVKTRFAEFYAALFDRTIEKHPGSVVTEYAWDASSCDPCPGPSLGWGDFQTLGADVIPDGGGGFVLTRLHARYGAADAKDDLVFKQAQPIVGGREHIIKDGKLEEGAQPSEYMNNFQARYAIRHPWTGPVECKDPRRGIWGGPPGDELPRAQAGKDLAFAPRGQVQLAKLVAQDIPELDVRAAGGAVPPPVRPVKPGADPRGGGGCGCGASDPGGGLLLLALGALHVSRGRRRRSSVRRTS